MADETTIGGILGFLRLDATQFHREIDAAIAEIEALNGADARVKVKADTATADAQLVATERLVESLDKANARVAVSSKQAGSGMGALGTAIIAIGPALVPLAAGAVGLGAAFGGMGAAGILAVVGVKNEMKAGTALGLTYKSTIDELKGSFNELTHVAAANTLGSFQAAVGYLQHATPPLIAAIGEFATMAGTTAAHLTTGLVSAFLTLEPLMRDAGAYMQTLSQKFADAMSGPGIVSFGDYVRSVFPQVMQAFEAIVSAAGHLIGSLAPLGMGVLSTLRVFADLINAIPVDVLSTLATLATSVFLGFRAWEKLSGIVEGLGASIARLGASAVAMGALNFAAAGVGIAIAALTLVMAHNAEKQREAQQAANDYADALRVTNGVIDESIRLMAAKRLSDDGTLDVARQLGVSQATVTDAVLQTAGAQNLLKAQVDAARESLRAQVTAQDVSTLSAMAGVGGQNALTGALKNHTATQSDAAGKYAQFDALVKQLYASLGLEGTALEDGAQKQKDLAEATNTTGQSTSDTAVAAARLAAAYGVSVPTFLAAAEAQQKQATSASAATAAMQVEGDAAGLLKQQLDILNGKSLNVAQAQTSASAATLALSKSLKDNGTSLSTNTEKGVANRQAIERKIQADQALAEATAKSTGSTKAGTQALSDSKAALEKTLRAQGKLTPAVQAYIDKLYAVKNLKVPPTKLEVDKAQAEADLKAFQDHLNNIHGHTVFMGVRYVQSGRLPNGGTDTSGGSTKGATGGLISNGIRRMAGGGLITGPGTGTSDSVPAVIAGSGKPLLVANGEFVSTDASRRRNMAALAAGNHGATLTVAGAGRSVTHDSRVMIENATIVTRDSSSFKRDVRSAPYEAKRRPGR